MKEDPQTWSADGNCVKLTVNATGLGTLSYQWLKDGSNIDTTEYPNCSGINSSTLTITPFSSEYEGSYSCLVEDQTGRNVNSDPVEVKGIEHVIIITLGLLLFAQLADFDNCGFSMYILFLQKNKY